jgi:hypothetical protein
MNGIAPADERQARKRQLEEELATVRRQKADVLRAIQQIAKKQKVGPNKTIQLSVEARMQAEESENRRQISDMMSQCGRMLAELLKNQNTKLYFGEPVHKDKYPEYYKIITKPIDLGTIKSECGRSSRICSVPSPPLYLVHTFCISCCCLAIH